MSLRTEQAYLSWIRRYARYHGLRHPAELGSGDVVAFLIYVAEERHVSRSTQAQAMSALLFLYRDVLALVLEDVCGVVRARVPGRLPVVLSRAEVRRAGRARERPKNTLGRSINSSMVVPANHA